MSEPELRRLGVPGSAAVHVIPLPTPSGSLRVGKHLGSGELPALSLVIPTFNEAKNISNLVQRLSALLDARLVDSYELIVVDDDSPDGTWAVALELAAVHPQLQVIRRRDEKGLSSAVIRGWQCAKGRVLAVIDADLQHPPESILQLYDEIIRGADLAVASRHIEGGGVSDWSLGRRFVSRAAQLLGLIILPTVVGRVSDPMSGYFMVRRKVVEGIELRPLGYKILIEVLARGRPRWVAEVAYVFQERAIGESKVTSRVYFEYLRHLMRLRLATLPMERFLRFALVGLSGVVIDMGILYLLSDPSTLGWGLTRSKLIAAELAILNNFYWNDRWTFRDLSLGQRGGRARLRRLAKFELVCVAGVALNTILLNFQFNVLGMNRYLANATSIAAVTAWNFWLNLKLSWRSTRG